MATLQPARGSAPAKSANFEGTLRGKGGGVQPIVWGRYETDTLPYKLWICNQKSKQQNQVEGVTTARGLLGSYRPNTP